MHNNDGLRLMKPEQKRPVGFVINEDSDELIETSGFQQKNIQPRIALPDGTQPLQLSSGYISGILGQGGAAVLYEIRNKDLGFHRAVKLLRPNHNNESLQRFIKEFKVCSQLNHPNIPVMHTVGQWHGLPFIEMEKVTGFSLLEMITKFAPLPVALVTAIGISICKALDYIHHCKYEVDNKHYNGFLHLDLKPSNIMLADTGLLKILDFGMATPILEAREGLHPDSSTGTSQYIAPEILFGKSTPDVRSDLFSLGCILFELITGTRVFSGSTHDQIMDMRQNHAIPSIRKIDRSVPESLIRLIERCLSFEKDQRPDSALMIRNQLEKIHRKHTRETADDIIALYTSKRRYNEPFIIPPPLRKSSAIVLYTSIVVSLIFVGIIAFNMLLKRDEFSQIRVSLYQNINKTLPFLHLNVTPSDNSVFSTSSFETSNSMSDIIDSFQTTDFSSIDGFYQRSTDTAHDNLLDTLRSKWTNRQFDELKTFIAQLPKELKDRKEVAIYRLRAAGSDGEDLANALDITSVNDGEYYFHTARYLFAQKRYFETLDCLAKAEALPSEYIDKRSLGTEVQLYRSRTLTAQFRDDPSSKNLNSAMNAWHKLLILLKDRPNSPQTREAQREQENLASEAAWRGIN